MPSNPAVLTVTGPSSAAASYAAGYPQWFPDTDVRPFNIGIGVELTSSAVGLSVNVEHSFDYLGAFSSNFNGWISSAATWYPNTGLNAVSSNQNGNYAFPVSAIRLNVLAGTGTVRCVLTQAG
jgi:hypothetical protein